MWVRHPDTQLLHAAMQLLLPVTLKLGQSIVGALWPRQVRLHTVARYLIARVVWCQRKSPLGEIGLFTELFGGNQIWQSCWDGIIFYRMDTLKLDTSQPPFSEIESERQRRLAREAAGIAEADAEFAAGLYVDADEIDTWIDSVDTDHELPPPPTRRL